MELMRLGSEAQCSRNMVMYIRVWMGVGVHLIRETWEQRDKEKVEQAAACYVICFGETSRCGEQFSLDRALIFERFCANFGSEIVEPSLQPKCLTPSPKEQSDDNIYSVCDPNPKNLKSYKYREVVVCLQNAILFIVSFRGNKAPFVTVNRLLLWEMAARTTQHYVRAWLISITYLFRTCIEFSTNRYMIYIDQLTWILTTWTSRPSITCWSPVGVVTTSLCFLLIPGFCESMETRVLLPRPASDSR